MQLVRYDKNQENKELQNVITLSLKNRTSNQNHLQNSAAVILLDSQGFEVARGAKLSGGGGVGSQNTHAERLALADAIAQLTAFVELTPEEQAEISELCSDGGGADQFAKWFKWAIKAYEIAKVVLFTERAPCKSGENTCEEFLFLLSSLFEKLSFEIYFAIKSGNTKQMDWSLAAILPSAIATLEGGEGPPLMVVFVNEMPLDFSSRPENKGVSGKPLAQKWATTELDRISKLSSSLQSSKPEKKKLKRIDESVLIKEEVQESEVLQQQNLTTLLSLLSRVREEAMPFIKKSTRSIRRRTLFRSFVIKN